MPIKVSLLTLQSWVGEVSYLYAAFVVVHFLILVSCQQNVLRGLGCNSFFEHESKTLHTGLHNVRAAKHSARALQVPGPERPW
jgi:hypothetical protein